MTDSTEARLAALRARRSGAAAGDPLTAPPTTPVTPTRDRVDRARTPRRKHVAEGSRILSAGLGVATMFGIVTVLGFDGAATTTTTPDPLPAVPATPIQTPSPVQVVIHRVRATIPTGTPAEASVTAPPTTASAATGPIVLTANPVVQTVTVAAPVPTASSPAPAAPRATTKGSG